MRSLLLDNTEFLEPVPRNVGYWRTCIDHQRCAHSINFDINDEMFRVVLVRLLIVEILLLKFHHTEAFLFQKAAQC